MFILNYMLHKVGKEEKIKGRCPDWKCRTYQIQRDADLGYLNLFPKKKYMSWLSDFSHLSKPCLKFCQGPAGSELYLWIYFSEVNLKRGICSE